MKIKLISLVLLSISSTAIADWRYSNSVDKMSGKNERLASISSDNSLSLDFPYSGKNHGHLFIRQHPQYGLDVILQVDKGQILCSSYGGCPVQVKFDDAPPMKLSGNPPADHDSKIVFIKGASKFITQAKKSKKIMVQVNMYHAGAPILEFSTTDPLKWESNKPTKK